MHQEELLANYPNLTIRKLENEVKRNGFIYKLVERANHRCLYAQYTKLGTINSYEVFLTKLGDINKTKESFAKLNNTVFEDTGNKEYYEIFPRDEEFGKRAWTYPNLELAKKAYDSKG